jgi:aldehyde dehydrogenase (NAD+)
VGDPLDPATEVGPVVAERQRTRIEGYLASGREEGATVALGGGRPGGPDFAKGWYVEPTVFSDVSNKMRIAQEEIFGPTTALIPVESFEEAVAAANSVPFGLSSSIFTRDVNRAFRAMRDLETGITYVNAGTTGAEVHLPFGGTKNTGNGHREAGQAALDVFTEWKSIYVDYSGRLQRAQIDNA